MIYKFPAFYATRMSITCSQASTAAEVISATGLDPESDESSPQNSGPIFFMVYAYDILI
jgi:hypothetical protein